MGRNLDPDARSLGVVLKKGVLVVLPRVGAGNADTSLRALRFQYNPETMTRARTGQWETRRQNRPPSAVQRGVAEGHRGGGLYANSETISMKLVFDLTDEILRTADSRREGVLPELGFLETVALGSDQARREGDRRQQGQNRLTEAAPAECILAIGPRSFPVVLTSLTIVEKRFLPDLIPIRAECDCKFRVLETTEILNNASVRAAFEQLSAERTRRRDIAAFVRAGGSADPDQAAIQQIIDAALTPRGGAQSPQGGSA